MNRVLVNTGIGFFIFEALIIISIISGKFAKDLAVNINPLVFVFIFINVLFALMIIIGVSVDK